MVLTRAPPGSVERVRLSQINACDADRAIAASAKSAPPPLDVFCSRGLESVARGSVGIERSPLGCIGSNDQTRVDVLPNRAAQSAECARPHQMSSAKVGLPRTLKYNL